MIFRLNQRKGRTSDPLEAPRPHHHPTTNPTSRGPTYGYLNVVTWADSAHAAQAKVTTHFKTLGWQILNFEPTPIPDDDVPRNDTIERARQDPKAITHGTFHSYRPS